MKITELQNLLENKIAQLNSRLISATQDGNIELLLQIEAELIETQESLHKISYL